MLEIKLDQLENINDIFKKYVAPIKTAFVENKSDIERFTL